MTRDSPSSERCDRGRATQVVGRRWAPVLAVALLALSPEARAAPGVCGASGAPGTCEVARADAPTSLAGTWRFRIGDDAGWAAPDLDDADWAPLAVPGAWGRQGHRGYAGYAWYRAEVRLDGDAAEDARAGHFGLRLGSVDSSYEIYVGGRRVGGVGGMPPDAVPTYDRHAVFPVPASAVSPEGRLPIALRVWRSALTRDFQGGVTAGPVEIGRLADLQRSLVVDDFPELGVVVLFALTGLYHVYLFWRRKALREYLWYGVAAVLLAVYTFLRTQVRFSISDDYTLLKNVEYLTLYLVPIASIEFFYGLFAVRVPWVARAVQLASAVIAVVAIATPTLGPNIAILTTWQYTMVAITALTFALIADQLRRGHPEARFLIGSFALLGLTIVNDVLLDQGLVQTVALTPYGFALFVMSMAASLANRFARTYSEIESLNADLEGRVRIQTIALEERTSELETKNKQLEEAYQQLHDSSLTDPLTGLRNRRFYQEHIELDAAAVVREHVSSRGIAGRAPSSLVFFVVDIDHFKRINDGHGHAAGDEVLTEVSRILGGMCRSSDYLVRWGGEEFLLVSRFVDRAGAVLLAERLRAAIAEHVFVIGPGLQCRVTVSVGFSCFPLCERDPDGVSHDAVLEVADACLYRVKETGRNGWVGVVRSLEERGRRLRLGRGDRWTTDRLEIASSRGPSDPPPPDGA